MGSCSLTRARAATQDGQGPELGRILRGAAADVQGLLQADGHQQGWPAGQERPARRLRQRRCAHVRVRARRSAGRDLWTLHLRQHGQDVPGEDGRRGQRPRRPHRPRLRSPPLLRRPLRPSLRGRRCQEEEEEEEEGRQVNYQLSLYFSAKTLADPDKPANFEDSTFQTRYGQYGGGNHPNNIVAWYLTSTNISFIMNSQFTNKYILLWGMELINTWSSEKCASSL